MGNILVMTFRLPAALALLAALALIPVRPAVAGTQAYAIGGGDVIEVNVWRNAELSRTVTVRPDGMISLPLITDIKAGGLSVEDLRKQITQALFDADLISQPIVSVGVVEAVSYRVYVLGAVAESGMFSLIEPVTALQLLAQAGGSTVEADLDKAYILHGDDRIPLRLGESISGGEEVVNPLLSAGDTLVVPRRESREEPVNRILVAGEVMETQAIPFVEGITVIDAFVQAGGGNEYADLDSVRVIRREKGKAERVLRVDLRKVMKKGDLGENIELVPGDIVIVP